MITLQSKQMRNKHPMRKKEFGVGLIEVLIAIVILSIGFLAAAKMQVSGMRYSQNAYFLSQGNFMLRDMTDRMRANREGVIAGHYNAFTTNAATVEPPCVAAGSKCTPAQIATADLNAWSQYLHAPPNAVDFKPVLPSYDNIEARGEIAYNAATDVYTISVRWGEPVDGVIEERILNVRLTP